MTNRFDPLPAAHLRERQKAASQALGSAAMILPGAPVRHRSRDTEYPYRPDSELYWLTGLTAPDSLAVLRGGEDGPHLTLFVPPRDPEAELWAGARPDADEVQAGTGADLVLPLSEVADHLPDALDGCDTLYFRLGAHPRTEAHVVDALRRARSRGQRRGRGPRRIVDPGEVLDELRLRKDAYELALIRAAADITVRAFQALEGELGPDVPEWRLQAVLESTFRGEGGDGPAYPTIVGSGANACVLHYGSNERVARAGELVLVDAGTSVGYYAADLTRTYPVDGRFTAEQRAVHQMVDQARAAAIAVIRPGATVQEVHSAAVTRLTEGLVELGLLEGEVEGLVAEESYKPFFPHQTSHWLGLDVHDVGDYALGESSRVLEAGMVLTVEPGIYFGPGALAAAGERAEAFAGVGVRIEDDLLVTPEGHENLTAGLPTTPAGG
jgi:Xaa-Pro aminopeptidase